MFGIRPPLSLTNAKVCISDGEEKGLARRRDNGRRLVRAHGTHSPNHTF